MKLLVFGASGQVATCLREEADDRCDVVCLGRPDGDLCRPETAQEAITAHRPDLVINAAAYTGVDKAESEEAAAFELNAEGPRRLAVACKANAIPLIHYSTDYVFDGTKQTPYTENDPTTPLGVYGRSKLAGEQAITAETCDHIILRTAWVYSPHGSNFVKTMLRLGNERDQLRIVSDQVGNPTSATDIAVATLQIAAQLLDGNAARGVYNLTGSGEASWHEFALAIFSAGAAQGRKTPTVEAIPSSEYPTPAKRPANSRLDGSKLRESFGVVLPHWSDGLERCLDRLKTS